MERSPGRSGDVTRHGGCLCGAVRFELTGPLSPIELCHCPKCRRAYGTAFAATLYARAEDFRWTAGAEEVATFDAPLEREPPAYRHCFCRRCGSPLPLVWPDLPFVELPAGALEGPLAVRPAYHQFTAGRPEGSLPDDGLERFERGAPPARKVVRVLFGRSGAHSASKASW